ncbi:uncharacterized protein TRAVEDRAFT_53386 [Trametes versicolor FP-101664 SS1]|uniref:uncharacterized protein n=1 Tax=Trametes versicolor (strain FP-101664) TaxID=717944 RepID=UPI0004621826|nr:uncharacterized protein TRAVEDRAFT_53386 [Trametes versicolor FP-101664 SS1]EIW52962.1 hypothetical protein TRAVEDRAFT_53386 [Trametes versicolor FP-101664 SS1]
MIITTILAKERGAAPAEDSLCPTPTAKHFDVPIVPRVPLHVGQMVHILSLFPCNGLFPGKGEKPPRYTAFDSGVWGKVVEIKSMDRNITEFVVRNEAKWAKEAYAYLAIKHIEGTTVSLGKWRTLLRSTIQRPAPATRDIPLEMDAIVYRDRPVSQDDEEEDIGTLGPGRERSEGAE